MSKIILGFIGSAICSFTFFCGWKWFLVPLGLVKITYIHAFGLNTFTSFIIGSYHDIKNSIKDYETDDVQTMISVNITYPIIVLLIMFLIHFFMP